MKQTHQKVSPPTRSKVNKAASAIRNYHRSADTPSTEDILRYIDALDTVTAYRAQFGPPLAKVNGGLRRFCTTVHIEGAAVTQRLKRQETIVDKLAVRQTSMSLASMQDIGGCRVVVPGDDVSALRRLEKHVRRWWSVRRVDDYITHPRDSGYRAIHIVVERDGYPIEVQLRTQRMHDWAQTVESFSGLQGTNYKQEGASDVQDLMRALSRIDQSTERGTHPSIDDVRLASRIASRVRDSL